MCHEHNVCANSLCVLWLLTIPHEESVQSLVLCVTLHTPHYSHSKEAGIKEEPSPQQQFWQDFTGSHFQRENGAPFFLVCSSMYYVCQSPYAGTGGAAPELTAIGPAQRELLRRRRKNYSLLLHFIGLPTTPVFSRLSDRLAD